MGAFILAAGLVLSMAAAVPPAWAQPATPGPVMAAADSMAVTGSPAAADAAAPPTPLTPRQILIRSALLPGWGQVANGKHLKGMLFGVATAGLAGYSIAGQRDLNRVSGQLDDLRRQDPFSPRIADLEAAVQDLAGERNTRILRLALSITAAALDAFVDAHLADFGHETELVMGPLPGSNPGLALACVRRF